MVKHCGYGSGPGQTRSQYWLLTRVPLHANHTTIACIPTYPQAGRPSLFSPFARLCSPSWIAPHSFTTRDKLYGTFLWLLDGDDRMALLRSLLWVSIWSCMIWPVLSMELDPIVVKGSHFFHQNSGDQFHLKGINYQGPESITELGFSDSSLDPLTNPTSCARDIPYLEQLGVNVVRLALFTANPAQAHVECMETLAEAGIYVFVELVNPQSFFSKRIAGSYVFLGWEAELFNRYTEIINSFAGFSNTMAFAIQGIIDPPNESNIYPMYKGLIRDIRSYLADKKYRKIPVGYVSPGHRVDGKPGTEDDDLLESEFMTCGDDGLADFRGIITPGPQQASCTTDESIKTQSKIFTSSSIQIPLFISGIGCPISPNTSTDDRNFSQIKTVFSDPLFSGGIVFDYFSSASNDSGVVQLTGEKTITTRSAFKALSSEFAAASPNATNAANYTPPAATVASCTATPSPGEWWANPKLPPAHYDRLCACMYSSLTCVANQERLKAMTLAAYQRQLLTTCRYVSDDLGFANCPGLDMRIDNGTYGAFSMCNRLQQYSYATNELWKASGKTDCDINGTASLLDQTVPSTDSACPNLMAQVGERGTGVLTATPSAAFAQPPPTSTTSTAPQSAQAQAPAFTTSAKVGLAVGVLGFSSSLVLGVLFMLQRKKMQRTTAAAAAQLREKSQDAWHGSGAPWREGRPPVEMDSRSPVELHHWCVPKEMGISTPRTLPISARRGPASLHGGGGDGSAQRAESMRVAVSPGSPAVESAQRRSGTVSPSSPAAGAATTTATTVMMRATSPQSQSQRSAVSPASSPTSTGDGVVSPALERRRGRPLLRIRTDL
ncbi:Glucanosyltransferase-domain-containing protein [Massariosphaeria phaeospora]|uniref:1,3-beta-glucanosyltransferase n=1 Tax=Massariosphaeria phaeospora TaxID=100035 RepID=A0A7C8I0M4_9PLEO|nr:Glucanosyltransferase-domain-containing protein [Massariosphaeria phaeospora]